MSLEISVIILGSLGKKKKRDCKYDTGADPEKNIGGKETGQKYSCMLLAPKKKKRIVRIAVQKRNRANKPQGFSQLAGEPSQWAECVCVWGGTLWTTLDPPLQ